MAKESSKSNKSTIAALLEEKPKRGRPRRNVSRQNVYVALDPAHKQLQRELAAAIPGVARADVPDLAVKLLAERSEQLRQATAGRGREIPEGITDFESLYLLWDLPLPDAAAVTANEKWTSIRLSPQQAIELGRMHGIFNTMFGTSRSEVFALALTHLAQKISNGVAPDTAFLHR